MYVMSSYGWDTNLKGHILYGFVKVTRVNEMAVTKAVNVIRNRNSVSLFVIKFPFK